MQRMMFFGPAEKAADDNSHPQVSAKYRRNLIKHLLESHET
jgi:hypothetical protein